MAIHSHEYGMAVCKALGIDHRNVRRVVVDAQADKALRVYVDFYGTKEMLNVALPTLDIEIKIANAKDSE